MCALARNCSEIARASCAWLTGETPVALCVRLIEMAIGTIVILAVALLLLVYLAFALLRPEKF
jgi:K+-transporting ATPase KdpF subunit